MTREQLAQAISCNAECEFEGAKYQCIGYQLLKLPNRDKEYSAGILDKNRKTILWVDIEKVH